MADYLAPAVYVEEVDTGSKPIEGVSTSIAGMIGVTERGPVNFPILVTGIGEYRHWFGGRLRIEDFSNSNGAHAYLPYAIEGFFTNQGKEVYVTRILDTTLAVPASAILFDRGAQDTKSTVLFRSAAEETGTIGTPPALAVLDKSVLPTGPTPPPWFRVGDGSSADYAQVDTVNASPADNYVALNFGLSRSHAAGAGVDEFARTPDNVNYVAAFKISTPSLLPTLPNASTLVLSGTTTDIAQLLGTTGQLLEIGSGVQVEYRFVIKAVALPPSPATSAFVTLDSGLALTYPNKATVTPLQFTAGPPADTLALASAPGDTVLFATSPPAPSKLVVLERNDTTGNREVRLVGSLFRVDLSAGAYEEYPSGSFVAKVSVKDDDVTVTNTVAAGKTSVNVSDVTDLEAGMKVIVDPTGVPQQVVIQSVVEDAPPAVSGTITFNPGLANPTVANTTIIQLPGAILTAPAPAGTTLIVLDSRHGLSEGDVLRIGPLASAEYMTVAALPAAGGPPPDPGNVVLAAPLASPWPSNTQIRRQLAPSFVSTTPSATVLSTAPGGSMLVVTDGTGYVAGDLIRLLTPNGLGFFHHLKTNSSALTAGDLYINTQWPLFHAHAVGEIVVPRTPLLTVQALDPGAWGNRLQVAVQDEPSGLVSGTTLTTIISPTQIKLASYAGVEPGTVLELSSPLLGGLVVGEPVKVIAINKVDQIIQLAAPGLSSDQLNQAQAAKTAGLALGVRSREFWITVWWLRQPDPALPSRNTIALDSESFRFLSMDPRHSRYVQTIVGDIDGLPRLSDGRPDGQSWYIRVHDEAQDLPEPKRSQTLWSVRLGPETLVDQLPTGGVRAARRTLEGGDDSIVSIDDNTYKGQDADDPKNRTGLFTLMNVDEISIVACPGRTSAEMQGAVIDHCETMLYRFAVLDSPPPPHDAMADVLAQRQQFDTKYAAIYYPWLTIDDPYPRNLNNVAPFAIPPSGHVMGIYARVDNDKGVHKAPANEVINGITGLQRTLYKPQQDILNPYPVNINVIRDFRQNDRGIVVYGARVITSDTDWKYVNVCRLLRFIEHSLFQGLQWAVFEVNYEPLWARVRRSITNFLTTVWRNGALEGSKPEEAFFVKCDQTTMTQTDIDNGRLIAIVGVAPVKPAEYVIIRIGLWVGRNAT
jgi:phage tail sheath protein FI